VCNSQRAQDATKQEGFYVKHQRINFFEIAQVSGGGNAAVSNIGATCDFDSHSSSRSGVPFR
jgi:hypothetical protein